MSTTSQNYPPPPQNFHSPPITIVLTVVLLIFFLLGFFSIYFCRCFVEAVVNTWHLQQTPSGNFLGSGAGGNGSSSDAVGSHNGLDPTLIKSFPTFLYSRVREVRKETSYGLECAICLVEFENDSLLRLLTVCYHVFHQECVDLWLESHKTCPVCRHDLESPPPPPPDPVLVEKSPEPTTSSGEDHAVRIDIREEEVEEEINDADDTNYQDRQRRRRIHQQKQQQQATLKVEPSTNTTTNDEGAAKRHRNDVVERFSRSHSTGHSITRTPRSEEDRYTLRLPENLKMKLLRGHHWTGSCETYGEFQHHWDSNGGFGEVSGDLSRI